MNTRMKIKKGDSVVIIAGKDKGKKGKVLDVRAQVRRIVVEGIALRKKHQRARKAGQHGEVITLPSAIDVSNVMIFCSHCSKGVRTGFQITGDEKKRVCRICSNTI